MRDSTTNIEKLLDSRKIEITPLRVQVLQIFVSKPGSTLSCAEVLNVLKGREPSTTRGVIAATLRLFRARNLIKEIARQYSEKSQGKPGRPKIEFFLPYQPHDC